MLQNALFVAAVPNKDDPTDDVWRNFLRAVDNKLTTNDEAFDRFSENVWLLYLHQSMAPLGWLIVQAETHGIAYRLLPFDGEPQWLQGGSDPKTI
jgi:hypothetical protein